MLLLLIPLAATGKGDGDAEPIDREALVRRHQIVLQRYRQTEALKPTQGIEEKMANRYGEDPILLQYDKIEKASPSEAGTGDVFIVNLVQSGKNIFGQVVTNHTPYYLEKTEQGYLILWEPSARWTPMAWTPYKVARPREPIDFPLVCTLDTSYYQTRENIKNSHYSVSVYPPAEMQSERIQAYVVRDSPAGKRVFETLSDGKSHTMILTVQFRDQQDEECLWITRVVSDKPWVYDDTIANRYTSPILVQESPSVGKGKNRPPASEAPFQVTDVIARWTIEPNVLGGRRMVVPEVRFRVAANAETIHEMTMKIVYLEEQKESTEIVYEDVQRVVRSSDAPLEKGFSKTVLSRSARGYQDLGMAQRIVEQIDMTADLYYDVGDGYVKLTSVVVQKILR